MRKNFRSIFISLLLIPLPLLFGCNTNDKGGNSQSGGTDNPPGGSESQENTLDDINAGERPSSDNFDFESEYVKEDVPVTPTPSSVPVDPAYAAHSTTKKYRLEGECATDIVLTGSNSGSNAWTNSVSNLNNTVFDFSRLSNKLSTRNFNSGNHGQFTLKFTSNKTYLVNAKMHISVWDSSESRNPFNFSEYLDIVTHGKKNEQTLTYDATYVDPNLAYKDTELCSSPEGKDPMYYHFGYVDIKMAIFEGQNDLIFTFVGGGGCNLDYVELDTSATITNFNTSYFNANDTFYTISVIPTETSGGKLTGTFIDSNSTSHTMVYPLPALLTNGAITEGYKKVTYEGNEVYAFDLLGQEYRIGVEEKVNVSIKAGSKLKFKGGATTISKPVGTVLSPEDFDFTQLPRSIEGIAVYRKTGEFLLNSSLENYVLQNFDIEIDASAYSPMDGYQRLTPGNEQNGSKPQSITSSYDGKMDGTNFNIISGNKTIINGGDNGYPQLGNVLEYTAALQAGNFCRWNTVVNSSSSVVTTGKQHQFDYNVENLGTSPIHLRFNQVNSGIAVESGDQGVEINLQPGESMNFVISITFAKGSANKNCLTLITLLDDAPNMKIGVSLAIKLGK